MRHDRGSSAAGVSRAGLALVGAVLAAALVLTSGALRSGPSTSASASTGASGLPGGSATGSALASLPPIATDAATIPASPAPPEPTALPDLRGDYVGALGQVDSCPILYQRDGVLGLVLPDGYRSRIRSGQVQIVGPGGAVVAQEGDLLGLDGRVREGGSFCMAGPQLHVTRIREVAARGQG